MTHRRHSWTERWLFAQAALSLLLARLALRRTSFWTVLHWLDMREGTSKATGAACDRQRAELIGWAVGAAAARLPWRSTCLMEALAGAALLRRHGLPGTLSLGVGKGEEASEETILAHAWLHCGGLVLTGEVERAHFAELVSFALP